MIADTIGPKANSISVVHPSPRPRIERKVTSAEPHDVMFS